MDNNNNNNKRPREEEEDDSGPNNNKKQKTVTVPNCFYSYTYWVNNNYTTPEVSFLFTSVDDAVEAAIEHMYDSGDLYRDGDEYNKNNKDVGSIQTKLRNFEEVTVLDEDDKCWVINRHEIVVKKDEDVLVVNLND